MSNSNVLIFISLFFFFIPFASSSPFNATHECSPQQALDLLLFKQGMSMSSINNIDSYVDFECQNLLGSDYHPIMMNWNKNTDCCKWGGVTCNQFTGDVVGIDLSCGMLRGIIHPKTTLFHLPHLQSLNLAFNDFAHFQLPSEIHRLSDSLTHLNLSQSSFTGEISVEILFLPKLVSLDLSSNHEMQMHPYVLENLLRNSTHLKELLLSDVDIGWVLPTYLNISSSLRSLGLSNNGLQGKLPDNIFNLPYLEKIDLSGNIVITGPLPKVNTNNNIPLKWLDLSFANLSGEIPDSIGHLKSLNYLALSSCSLVGSLPKSIFNLRHLTTLDLSNNKLNGTLKASFLQSNRFDSKTNIGSTPPSFIQFTNLTQLDLSSNDFTDLLDLNTVLSSLPNLQRLSLSYSGLVVVSNNGTSYVNNHPELWYLYLASCKLTIFPESLRAMENLQSLDLSYNRIQGRIPDWARKIGRKLIFLDLSNNFITGLPQFQCDVLERLYLHSNQIKGPFPPSICNMRNLMLLDISNNSFSGMIPQCLGNISSSLLYLNVKSNQLQGLFPPSICKMKNLASLDISYNSVSGLIPQCLENIKSSLGYLNVKSNKLQGPFPPSICNMTCLYSLDMSNNSFSGGIPQCLRNISSSLEYLNVKSNKLQGPFPPSICNMGRLTSLDMSNNMFDGVLPECLGNISSSLVMADMGNNIFEGIIPNVYQGCGQLQGLILNGNRLHGEVPSSLSKCQSLKVLDLGNNQLNGTFPGWLGDLPMLQVLVLKSNKLHGPIETHSPIESAFPSMQVLVLSHNEFVGLLPQKYLQNFIAMKNTVKDSTTPTYLDMGGKYYSVTTAVKGVDLAFPKISVDYTIIDLSNNRFEGEIPGVIGCLTSLVVLDLSHNILTGQIPNALGNLSEIESLDLSWNQLTGEIPRSLADLTFLGFLNLSQNHLVGRIPSGTQFTTFGTSFAGNPELCGLPLPKKCGNPKETHLEVDGKGYGDEDGDGESGFTWKVVMMGYGCGIILGLVMGYLMLSTGRPKWFNDIADAGENMIRTR